MNNELLDYIDEIDENNQDYISKYQLEIKENSSSSIDMVSEDEKEVEIIEKEGIENYEKEEDNQSKKEKEPEEQENNNNFDELLDGERKDSNQIENKNVNEDENLNENNQAQGEVDE